MDPRPHLHKEIILNQPVELSRSGQKAILALIAITNFTALMNTTAVSILLPVFMKEFNTDLVHVQWVATAYVLTTCIVAPTVGYFSDRFSIRRAFLFAVAGFAVTTFLCGCVSSLGLLIAMRTLQGMLGGLIMPLTQSMIYQLFPRHRQANAISIWATTNLLAPTIGPSLAGIISDALSWRFIFWITVPIMALVILVAMRLIPYFRFDREGEAAPFDTAGLILSVVGSVCLLIAFSNITVWGLTSPRVAVLTLAGLTTLAIFFRLESKKDHPLLQVGVFRCQSYPHAVFLLCLGSTLIQVANAILPVYLQHVAELTTTQSALVLLPAPLCIMFVVPIMGKYYDRIGPQKLLYAIVCTGILACLLLGGIHAQSAILYVILATIVRDLGSGTFNMPATNMGMQAVPVEYSAHASAVIAWIRQCWTALAIGLGNTMVTARTGHWQGVLSAPDAGSLYKMAYSAAMDDVFHAILVLFVCGLFVVYFSRSKADRRAAKLQK